MGSVFIKSAIEHVPVGRPGHVTVLVSNGQFVENSLQDFFLNICFY
jgi:hypothetical protein